MYVARITADILYYSYMSILDTMELPPSRIIGLPKCPYDSGFIPTGLAHG
jgi:hypothetical protein